MITSFVNQPVVTGFISPFIGSGGGGSSIPFSSDANTSWWDFTSASNDIEPTGDDTIAYIPDPINGIRNLESTTKDFQPIKITDGGGDFHDGNSRRLDIKGAGLAGLTNGSAGWYCAFLCKPITTGSYLLTIARNLYL